MKLLRTGGLGPRAGRASCARLMPVAVWGLLPIALIMSTALRSRAEQVHLAGDFHYAFWPAGQRILHGLSPYVDPGSPTIAHATAFVYPAPGALLFAPFALIPHGLADAIFAGLQIAAALLTLRMLEVRDWRLYGLMLLCPAVFSGWSVANVTLLLGLGIATIWRYRDRPLVIGFLTALLISVKLFLWPLALWLLATRRYAALGYAAACGVVLNCVAWAVLGFGELHRYSRLLHALTATEERRGYSLVALARHAGLGHDAAYALALTLAASAAVSCIAMGRRAHQVSALAIAIGASLLATPIVQLHYFALLIVPLAIVRPRLSLAWGLPLALWACASEAPRPWQVASALAIGAAIIAVTVRRDSLDPLAPGRGVLHLRLARPSSSSVAAAGTGG